MVLFPSSKFDKGVVQSELIDLGSGCECEARLAFWCFHQCLSEFMAHTRVQYITTSGDSTSDNYSALLNVTKFEGYSDSKIRFSLLDCSVDCRILRKSVAPRIRTTTSVSSFMLSHQPFRSLVLEWMT